MAFIYLHVSWRGLRGDHVLLLSSRLRPPTRGPRSSGECSHRLLTAQQTPFLSFSLTHRSMTSATFPALQHVADTRQLPRRRACVRQFGSGGARLARVVCIIEQKNVMIEATCVYTYIHAHTQVHLEYPKCAIWVVNTPSSTV